jgi:hypothetical protein
LTYSQNKGDGWLNQLTGSSRFGAYPWIRGRNALNQAFFEVAAGSKYFPTVCNPSSSHNMDDDAQARAAASNGSDRGGRGIGFGMAAEAHAKIMGSVRLRHLTAGRIMSNS